MAPGGATRQSSAHRSLIGFVTIPAKHRAPLGWFEGNRRLLATLRTYGASFNSVGTAVVGLLVRRAQGGHTFRFARLTMFGRTMEVFLSKENLFAGSE